ncbi:MAG TPA: hypothetical protein VMI54_21785 [Polyangiaceae bacterium]|nr:hypothetical protein [Polyangiaceae bacterium]
MDVLASEDEQNARRKAEAAFPAVCERLGRVWGEPLGHLELAVDHDTWPAEDASVLELVLELAPPLGAARFMLAPYLEGGTWAARHRFEERAAADFFARVKPRVDARVTWGARELVMTAHHDGSELGEEPLVLSVKLGGAEAQDAAFAAASQELPSLGELVETGATVGLFRHTRAGDASKVDEEATELDLRLSARLGREDVPSVTLWQSRCDRLDRVLAACPRLAACRTALERRALLSAYRERPLRAAARARERRDRIAATLEGGGAVPDADRFAAAQLLALRGERFALRRQSLRAADAFNRAASLLAERFDDAGASYAEFFALWRAATRALGVLAKAGNADAFAHYARLSVELARSMRARHPTEPDYARALGHSLLLGAEAVDARSGGLDDAALEEALELFAGLERQHPWPWRQAETERIRARVESLYARHHAHRSDRISSLPPRSR